MIVPQRVLVLVQVLVLVLVLVMVLVLLVVLLLRLQEGLAPPRETTPDWSARRVTR